MKRFLSVLLVLMVVVSAFTGCKNNDAEKSGGSKSEPEKIEIISQNLDVVLYDDGTLTDYWNGIISAFEAANSGVTVNATMSKDAAYDLRDMILGGSSPDFVYLPADEESGITAALIKDRAMTVLDDVAEKNASAVFSGAFDNVYCKPYDDGKTYLAPLFFEQEGLIYNKKLLSENGWSLPTTWDEFVALAEKCDEKNIAVFTYAGREPEEFVNMFAAAAVPAVGTEQMNKLLSCDKDTWTDNEQAKAFAEKLDAIKKLVVSGSSTKTHDDVTESFKKGEALFISGSTADLAKLLEDENEDYGFAAYPSLSGERVNVISVSEMYIPIEAKNADLGKKFMSFLYSDAAAAVAAETVKKLPPVASAASLAAQYEFGAAEKEAYSALTSSVYAPKFMVKAADNESLSDEFCALAVSVFKGDVKPEEFASKMVEYIEKY